MWSITTEMLCVLSLLRITPITIFPICNRFYSKVRLCYGFLWNLLSKVYWLTLSCPSPANTKFRKDFLNGEDLNNSHSNKRIEIIFTELLLARNYLSSSPSHFSPRNDLFKNYKSDLEGETK